MHRLRGYNFWRKSIVFTFLFSVFLFIWANVWVHFESQQFVSNDLNELPTTKVGLLLGTSMKMQNGSQNPFFTFRLQAALELYQSGKIKYILISGDNSTKQYNEPEDMMFELIHLGVPEDRIKLDYAGFDTYDSVIRARKIFGQTSFIIISQDFHAERGVYIGRRFGYDVWGYAAKDVARSKSFMTHVREYFARVKAYVEVKLGVDPYFLGEKIKI